MRKLTGQELKDIQYRYDISNIELSHYTGYNSQYISAMRGDKLKISVAFQVALLNFLITKRKVDSYVATDITGLTD